MNINISSRYTFRDPSHLDLGELMSAIFVVFFQTTMLLRRFIFSDRRLANQDAVRATRTICAETEVQILLSPVEYN